MINSHELRLGNWVTLCFDHIEGWYPAKVTEIYKDNSIGTDTTIKVKEGGKYYYEPIPLTEDIIVKCGFEWDIFYQGFTDGRYVIDLIQDGTVRFAYCKRRRDDIQFLPYIKYLHQLQNIYFAVTAIELTINL